MPCKWTDNQLSEGMQTYRPGACNSAATAVVFKVEDEVLIQLVSQLLSDCSPGVELVGVV